MKKYKTEVDFCEDTTKMILGLLVGESRKIICVPEVPYGFFSNEQIDMLLLDVKNQQYLCIEYKLNGLEQLQCQVRRNNVSNIPCIGIVNTNTKIQNKYSEIFGYTGTDMQIEAIAKTIIYKKYQWRWRTIFSGLGMMYYWAYKDDENNFRGGVVGGNRIGFAAIYKQAIRNLHKEYGHLDFLITHSVLGSGYGIATSRKHYNQALQDS